MHQRYRIIREGILISLLFVLFSLPVYSSNGLVIKCCCKDGSVSSVIDDRCEDSNDCSPRMRVCGCDQIPENRCETCGVEVDPVMAGCWTAKNPALSTWKKYLNCYTSTEKAAINACTSDRVVMCTECWGDPDNCQPPGGCTPQARPLCGYGADSVWYAQIYMDKNGFFIPGTSKAYNMTHGETSGGAECFIEVIKVYNNGWFECWDHTGDPMTGSYTQAECIQSVEKIGLKDLQEAWSGRYTILGDPIDYVYPSTGEPHPDSGKHVVVSGEYITIGINEAQYVKEMYNQRQRKEPEFASTQLFRIFTITKMQDSLGILTTEEGRTCKNERLYPIDYEIEGITDTNAWTKNIEKYHYGGCNWLMIDFSKQEKWPGILFVVLNKSKFGYRHGFGYYAIVGQEGRGFDYVYPESIVPDDFNDLTSPVCCSYREYNTPINRCLTTEECTSCPSPKTGCTILLPADCADSSPQFCGYDRATGLDTQTVKNSILTWNFDAGPKLLGCDTCLKGELWCSMGASLANARYFDCQERWNVFDPGTPGCSYSDYPYSPEQRCGHYFISNRYVAKWDGTDDTGTCDCLTGKAGGDECSERQCTGCRKMGWKTNWKGSKCIGQPYTIEPTGQPDYDFIWDSIKSIQTNISEYFLTYTQWWYNACGDNQDGATDGTPGMGWSLPGEGYQCKDGAIACTLFDCKVPWNGSASNTLGNWDYAHRGGGVSFIYYIAQGTRNYSHYKTGVDANNCSDFIRQVGNGVEYWQDRYTKCGDSSGKDCNCTRPEHIPKDHTPCYCPDGVNEGDCCIEYVDYDAPLKPSLIKEVPGNINCVVDDPRCFFYGETPGQNSIPEHSTDAMICLCDYAPGACPDNYCSQSRSELPIHCQQDCDPCGGNPWGGCCYTSDFTGGALCPCNEDGNCGTGEHYSWCIDCQELDYDQPYQCKESLYGLGKWNKCMCGDGACWPLGGEDYLNCSNDCGLPGSADNDGVCWAPAEEHWSDDSKCYHDSWQGTWDEYCGLFDVDCKLPRAHASGVCEYWDEEWGSGDCPKMISDSTGSPCPEGPNDICCQDDGLCMVQHEDATCADCQPVTPISCDNDCSCESGENRDCDASMNFSAPCNPSTNPGDQCMGRICDWDGVCEPVYGEGPGCDNCANWPICFPDGICWPPYGEDVLNCASDCPIPPSSNSPCDDDGLCFPDYGETNETCGPEASPYGSHTDCPYPPGFCGDRVCWTDTPAYMPPGLSPGDPDWQKWKCAIAAGGPGYENGDCCPEDCTSKGGECSEDVCWPILGDTYLKCDDCPPPPGEGGDGVCEWWNGETEPTDNCGEDDTKLSPVCEPIDPDDNYSAVKCCRCPGDKNPIDYDPSYYRQFTRDSVWSYIPKITPEVSNVSIRWCTKKIDCRAALKSVNDMISLATGDVFQDLKQISYIERCGVMASKQICDGCYSPNDVNQCYNCNGVDGNPAVGACSDYTNTETCLLNPCRATEEFYPAGQKFGGCFPDSGGGCEECSSLKDEFDPCGGYSYLEECDFDPCNLGNCGWNDITGACEDKYVKKRTCANVCSGGGCTYEECKSGDKIAIEKGCSYANIDGTGEKCNDCNDIIDCSMIVSEEVCKDDLCDIGCYWDTNRCNSCKVLGELVGCPGYADMDICFDNPCGLDWGCGWDLNETCTSCKHILKCEDYSHEFDALGKACIADPCGVGPCGIVDEPIVKCIRKTDVGCLNACEDDIVDEVGPNWCNREECQHVNATRAEKGGCYWMYDAPGVGNNCISCNGQESQDRPSGNKLDWAAGVAGCMDYPLLEPCIEDWCGVGPCYWDESLPETDWVKKCRRAFDVDTTEAGWIRTGGRGAGEDDYTGVNAGGGPYWAHSAGGADIPNYSESVGTWGTLDPDYCNIRNGSIWSEVKDYMTLKRVLCLLNLGMEDVILAHLNESAPFSGKEYLAACDIRTQWYAAWRSNSGEDNDITVRLPQMVIGAHDAGVGVNDPPYVCGTLCGKYVRGDMQPSKLNYPIVYYPEPYFAGDPYWSRAEYDKDNYLNPWMPSTFNLTVNETYIGGDSEITVADLYFRETKLRSAPPHGDFKSPDPEQGNILPAPGHPYTIFNWFNMPDLLYDERYKLDDSTLEVRLSGNYTVNMSLFRDARAMQCLWDSCLPYGSRWFIHPDEVPGDGDCSCYPGGLFPPDRKPWVVSCAGATVISAPYPDSWKRCHKWHPEDVDGDGTMDKCVCDKFRHEFRCLYCWMLQDCDYPVEMEEINDTSSVLSNVYGENLTTSRPLDSSKIPHVNFYVKGYVDLKEPGGVNGSITIRAEPDILNGFSLLVPRRFRLEFVAKDYPVEHELFRTELTKVSDECSSPSGNSPVYCALKGGKAEKKAECEWYDPYEIYRVQGAGGSDKEPQTVTCLDQWTKDILNRFAGLRQPENAHFYIVENFKKKFYHFLDRFGATDKYYTWEIGVYGIDAGLAWNDRYWFDIGKTIGTFRNFHEDEPNYYDLARLYPDSRELGVWIESKTLGKNVSNVNMVQIDSFSNMNGDVEYNDAKKEFKFDFWGDGIDVNDFRNSRLILYEHYRSIPIGLIGDDDGSLKTVSRNVTERKRVNILIQANCVGDCSFGGKPQAYRDAVVTASLSPVPPGNRAILLEFLPPYEQYSQRIISGTPVTIKLKDSSATIKAYYDGYWDNDPTTKNDYQYETAVLQVPVIYKGTLSWIMRHIWLVIIAFFAIVSYRWFRDHRMDFEKMVRESGLWELLQDFLGLK